MSPSPTPPFVPKQALGILANAVDVYEKTGGKVTAQFAEEYIKLVSPFPADSVIHDNACGPGTVTRKIMATSPLPTIKIVATDSNPAFLSHVRAAVIANKWPVEVENMRSEAVALPNDYFTHSFTNIAIFMMGSAGLDGATEIYRTLKPGGVAVVNCWQTLAWLEPIKAVQMATRSPGRAGKAPPVSWADGTQLRKVMVQAGFKEENITMSSSEASAVAKDLHSWAELSWAYLGGLQGWAQEDEDRWDEAIDLLVAKLQEAVGTTVDEDGIVYMEASQHMLIAKK
ncbi:S-adenosyl-L-methionine-dependent methyltransferase [Mytilinidion resinicola]|uniref:S-adenosyl-L-methionine-dependent methyltransferase n=1 Tax=Mytilinidion resinicola TaxID=574789 RepID=A0A6A6YER6_9PEZI|nr:S-adenosyl-L-methionine-dependent methyltransferase [Mytilinidion resinicola]KAF2806545.1 S-adenosyl-L-methionine-dependent methyltransferase [Mytilinidion resinicola]